MKPLLPLFVILLLACHATAQLDIGIDPVPPGTTPEEGGTPPAEPTEPIEPVEPVAPVPKEAMKPIIGSNGLLKVNVTYQAHNPLIPWQKQQPGGRRGLGVVLEGRQVLVTAQMIADATYIELEQPSSGQKLTAKVKTVDYEANLALIVPVEKEKEEAFFAKLRPMEIDTGVRIGDSLALWQTGSTGNLIVTPLSVSKVETANYFVSGSNLLVYECNGIVRGEANSFTLPVVKRGKLAGLLLRYNSQNQVTTVLPGPIIDHFLKDNAKGDYEGFPSLGAELHSTLDEQFREYLGMKPGAPGVYIGKVAKRTTAEAIGLKEGDILTQVNEFTVDTRGNYKDPQYGSLSLGHLVRGRAQVGDPIKLNVLREGKELTLEGKLIRKKPEDFLVTPYRFDKGPNYVLAGGLLFQELSQSYMSAYPQDRRGGAVLRLSWLASHPEEFEEKGYRKIVFLSAVLPTPGCQGFERLGGQILERVNGKDVRDLSDLDKALREPLDGVHTFEFREFPRFVHIDAVSMERDKMALLSGNFRVGSLKRIE